MLPKCVLPSAKRGGHHNKPVPIELLCAMWADGKISDLWHKAVSRSSCPKQPSVPKGDTVKKRVSIFDIRPVAVGESLRNLVGKCLCAAVKTKAAEFYKPFQFGVACSFGAENIAHGLRTCIENHWLDDDFIVLKVDMKNAFNMVSCQALFSECSTHFPELLPRASWCYSQHPILWHPLGHLRSEQWVQQGDPLGPLFFSLVLNILVSKITSSGVCANLSYHAGIWMMVC